MMLAFLLSLALSTGTENQVDRSSRISHFECFNIVRVIERELQHINQSSQIPALRTKMAEHCEKLEGQRKDVCTKVTTEESFAKIQEYLKQLKRPDFICTQLGYPRGATGTRVINTKVCSSIVNLIKRDLLRSRMFNGTHFVPSNATRRFFNHTKLSNHTTPVAPAQPAAAALLEDPPVNNQQAPVAPAANHSRDLAHPIPVNGSHNANFTHLTPPIRRHFNTFFRRKSPRACDMVSPDDRVVCHVLTRLIVRTMRREVMQNVTSSEICKKLEDLHLITLTNKTVLYDSTHTPRRQYNDGEHKSRRNYGNGDEADAPHRRHDTDDDAPVRRRNSDDDAVQRRRRAPVDEKDVERAPRAPPREADDVQKKAEIK
ncbi:hypothetical protein TRFO_13511 [Tritrichomonas foetus]|uniref:Saposin B-type domain-containing protein n=1 Tax=Tritrichomonas foetus TaxID=1144522 RepID=A0A1J4KXP5_9EUKA|nr:hypothetical protein TRFO_13511 [Tritrichomonas foetus]|eukprot:OHT16025.1 hypothetical protein TRFO_13511 [Tritrichomonas foetus]